jgi:two-component system, cell cycle sensor histidine kinase and response regulator CckA
MLRFSLAVALAVVVVGATADVLQLGGVYSAALVFLVLGAGVQLSARAIRSAQARGRAAQDAAMLRIAGKVARLGGWTIELPSRTLTWSDENCAIHDVPPGYKPTLDEGIAYFPPEYRADVVRHVDACARDGTPYDFELPKFTATGRKIWVRSIGEAVRDAEGRIVRLQGAFQDISERKRAEQALRQAQEELHQSQKMDSVGRLAAGIAHDFNNLLTVINGFSEAALAKALDPETRVLIEEVSGAGHRAAELTRQFLAFGQKQLLRPELVDLKVIVSGKVAKLQQLLGGGVTLTVTSDSPSPLPVFADPRQLEVVIVNLALNARDAMPGGGALTITMDQRIVEKRIPGKPDVTPGPFAVLAVTDTGLGISGPLHQIFEPYFTTKGVGQGSGLGLASIHGIVGQSGGFVEVGSEPGQGTTFTIYIPLAQAGPGPAAALNRSE